MKQTEIKGFVQDTSGEALPGVTMTLEGITIQIELMVITNALGEYHFKDLEPGQYKVTASLMGFKPVTKGVFLELGQTERVNFTLQLS